MSSLSVVIPARNEAGRIGAAIRTVHETLAGARIDHNIIVVDDASTDRTKVEALGLQTEYPLAVLSHRSPWGKGGAIATGFGAAAGDYAAFIDADLEFPPEALLQMWQAIHAAPEPRNCCAVGERSRDERTLIERLSSRAAHLAIRLALQLPVEDTQAGIKIFPGWFAREVLTRASETGWMFDVEALLLARRWGLNIACIPLCQRRVRPRRASAREYMRCAIILARLATAAPSAPEVAATKLD